jgi:putative ABC transport system substrate-binding protein
VWGLALGDRMRPLLSALAWALIAATVDIGAASAQQSGDRIYRIGLLWSGGPGLLAETMEEWRPVRAAFRDELRNGGYVIGKNLVVDVRHAYGDVARLGAEAAALVASNVDVIVAVGTASTVAAMQSTRHVPIVFAGVADPVEKGIVASIARPGGNVTGIAGQIAGPKLWQLLHEVAPTAQRAAVLAYRPNMPSEDRAAAYLGKVRQKTKAAADATGIEALPMSIDGFGEVGRKFAELAGGGDAGIVIVSDPTLFLWRTSIMAMAQQHRLVTVCPQSRAWAEAGCLVTYAEDEHATNRRAAAQVVKILKGTRPADIPVEEPTHFKLIINNRTAKALGLTVPLTLLAAADEVIE